MYVQNALLSLVWPVNVVLGNAGSLFLHSSICCKAFRDLHVRRCSMPPDWLWNYPSRHRRSQLLGPSGKLRCMMRCLWASRGPVCGWMVRGSWPRSFGYSSTVCQDGEDFELRCLSTPCIYRGTAFGSQLPWSLLCGQKCCCWNWPKVIWWDSM